MANALRALWRILNRQQRWAFLGLCVLLALTAFMEMGGMIALFGYVRGLEANPRTGERSGPVGHAVDFLLGGSSSQLAFVITGGSLVVAFMMLKNLQGTWVRFSISRFLTRINRRISERLFRSYMLAPYEMILDQGYKKRSDDVSRLFDLFNSNFNATIQLLSDSTMVGAVLLLLFYLDFQLALLGTLLFASVGFGLFSLLRRYLSNLGKELDQAEERSSQFLREGLRGLIEVRLRGSVEFFIRGYGQSLGRVSTLRRRKDAMAKLPRSGNELALTTLIVGATVYVTLQSRTVAEALPTLGVFGFAGLRLSSVLSRLNGSAQTLRLRLSQFDEAYENVRRMAPSALGLGGQLADSYLDDEEARDQELQAQLIEKELLMSHVSYRYPNTEKAVLSDVSLSIRRGQFVAVCGPSGSGKTTLLLLLLGVLRPTSGSILCDGVSIHSRIRAWHRGIGYVSQNLFVVGRSIRENVSFGMDPQKVDDEEIWRALTLASADKFVRGLPNQLDTRLIDAGDNLSGGQRQRLTIARALYGNPELLVLDEATAALDNVTEKEITNSIAELGKSKTVLVVAHRLSTIRNADRIYFMVDGKIRASGTFEELLASDPMFLEMANAGSSFGTTQPQDHSIGES